MSSNTDPNKLALSVSEMKDELATLTAKRSLRPSTQENNRMRELLNSLYEITGDNIYNL